MYDSCKGRPFRGGPCRCSGSGGLADLGGVVGSAERNAERASNFVIGETDGGEDMRFAALIGGTGGASREIDILLFEFIDKTFGVKSREANRNETNKLVFRIAEKNRLDFFGFVCYNRGMC